MPHLTKVLIMTPVGRTVNGQQIDYFPTRWSGSSGNYKVTSFYPYNLGYLSTYLKQKGTGQVKVRMIDANYYGVDSEEYLDILKEINPDIYIVEIDSIIYEKQMSIISTYKRNNPDVKIIVCGPHPTATPKDALSKGADYVAIGEFEYSITQLILSGFDQKTLGIYPNARGPLVTLNDLPFPENEDIKRRDYCRLYGSEHNEVEMWTTRGCPVMCNFCVVTNIYYGKSNYRTRDIDDIIQEIRMLQKSIKSLKGIFFNEEAHTIKRAFLKNLCLRLIEEGLNQELYFNCMGNYDTLTEELLVLMKKANYYKIRVGIESLDNENMQLISSTKLKSDSAKFSSVIHICRDLGIKVYGTLSVGTYGSTYEKDIQTLDKVWELHQQHLIQEFSLSINTPMIGTPFFDLCNKNGWLAEGFLDYDGTRGAMINLPDYPADKINQAFAYGSKIREKINHLNRLSGIQYSSYDKAWCSPVYATSNRSIGTGIL